MIKMKRILIGFLLLTFVLTAFAAQTAPEVPQLEGPYIVTTCGQSPGAVMISMSAMQTEISATHNSTLTAEDLVEGEYKTLIVTTGTSMKGMGALL